DVSDLGIKYSTLLTIPNYGVSVSARHDTALHYHAAPAIRCILDSLSIVKEVPFCFCSSPGDAHHLLKYRYILASIALFNNRFCNCRPIKLAYWINFYTISHPFFEHI